MENKIDAYFFSTIGNAWSIGRYLPAPGTAGSVVALITGFFLAKNGFIILFSALLLVTILGIFAADSYSRLTNTDDAAKWSSTRLPDNGWSFYVFPQYKFSPVMVRAGFILFRLFDILKPWPVSAAERLPRHWGDGR